MSGLCTLVLIASALVLTRTPFSGQRVETFGLDTILASDVIMMTRTDAVGPTEVTRGVEGWAIGGGVVSSSSIEIFLASLPNAQATQVAKQGRTVPAYGFTEGTHALSIKTKAGTTISLDIGAKGPTAGSVYVTRPQASEVYLLVGTTLGDIGTQDWRAWKTTASTSTPTIDR